MGRAGVIRPGDIPALVVALEDRLHRPEEAAAALEARVAQLELAVAENTATIRRLAIRADRVGYQLRTGRQP